MKGLDHPNIVHPLGHELLGGWASQMLKVYGSLGQACTDLPGSQMPMQKG